MTGSDGGGEGSCCDANTGRAQCTRVTFDALDSAVLEVLTKSLEVIRFLAGCPHES